jgi:methyl-accepting chemotaxis protein
MLAKAGVEGRLTTRGNAGNFKGGYKEIVQGVNETLDAVIKPTQEGVTRLGNNGSR